MWFFISCIFGRMTQPYRPAGFYHFDDVWDWCYLNFQRVSSARQTPDRIFFSNSLFLYKFLLWQLTCCCRFWNQFIQFKLGTSTSTFRTNIATVDALIVLCTLAHFVCISSTGDTSHQQTKPNVDRHRHAFTALQRTRSAHIVSARYPARFAAPPHDWHI